MTVWIGTRKLAAEAGVVFPDHFDHDWRAGSRERVTLALRQLEPGVADPVDGPVNVASGDPRTVLDMARALGVAFGEDAPTPQVTGEWRAGDVRHVFADPARARRELGFSAQVAFSDGMVGLATAPLRTSLVAGRRGAGCGCGVPGRAFGDEPVEAEAAGAGLVGP